LHGAALFKFKDSLLDAYANLNLIAFIIA